MRLLLLLFVGLGLAFSLNSCKREKDCDDPSNPDCSNYDPCFGVKPVETEIELSQRVDLTGKFRDLYLEGDDVFPKTQIRFHCPLDGAKYTWKLGTETITEQTFERHFFDVPFGEYSVSLIVEKQPNKQCYPNDDGVDTIIKKFKTVPPCELECYGIFKGNFDNSSTDSSIITIRTFYDNTYKDSCSLLGRIRFTNLLTNLLNNGDTLFLSNSDYFVSNTEIIQYSYPALGFRKFKSKVDPIDKSVAIEFFISEEKYTFRGRKIAD